MVKDNVYKHFSPLERPFIARVSDWLAAVQEKRRVVKTDFLDPRQAYILKTLTASEPGVEVVFSGGYPEAERQRAMVYHGVFSEETLRAQMGLALLEVTWTGEVKGLEHKDFLGSLMSIGLKRDKIGDLWMLHEGVQVVVAAEDLDYICYHWSRVGHHSLHVEPVSWDRLILPEVKREERVISLSSMRLDAFVSELCYISRSKAVTLIEGQKVKVNWKVELDADRNVKEEDLLSVRGYGRFRVLAELSESKRGKRRVQIGKVL